MRQRGRKSAAANVVALPIDGRSSRLTPPPGLTNNERLLFTELVAACSPNHFVKSDLPLLTSFVQATLLTRGAAAGMADDPDLIATFEKGAKLQAMLATRLRLAPQSRIGPKTVGRQQAAQWSGPRPWENN